MKKDLHLKSFDKKKSTVKPEKKKPKGPVVPLALIPGVRAREEGDSDSDDSMRR